jgi:hypothetical protein
MNDDSFKIFIPKRKYRLTIEFVVLMTIFLALGFTLVCEKYYPDFYQSYNIHSYIYNIIVTAMIFAFILFIISFNRREYLNGYFDGILEFHKNMITINKKEINLSEIRSIEIENRDFTDKQKRVRGFSPKNSLGVSNKIMVTLKNGEIITTYFLQEEEFKMHKHKATLLYYFKEGKISLINLIHSLQLSSYTEIQRFKNENGLK